MLEEVRTLVARCLEIAPDTLGYDTDMSEVEAWDSMRNVIILATLEETYDVMIPEDDIFDLVTVRAIADEIAKLKNNG